MSGQIASVYELRRNAPRIDVGMFILAYLGHSPEQIGDNITKVEWRCNVEAGLMGVA